MDRPSFRDLASLLAILLPAAAVAGALVALPAERWGQVPSRVVHAAIEWASVFPALAVAYVGIASRKSGAPPLGYFLGLAFLASTCIDIAHPFAALRLFPEWIDEPRAAQAWTWTLARLLCGAIVIAGTSAFASRRVRLAELHHRVTRGSPVVVAAVCLVSLACAVLLLAAPPATGTIVGMLNVVAALLFGGAAVLFERAHRESARPIWRSAAIAFLLFACAEVVFVSIGERAPGSAAGIHLLELVAKGVLFAGLLRDHAFLGGRERELRRKLESERRRLQRVLDASADGVVVVRRDDEILLANPAAGALLGLPRGSVLMGKRMADVLAGRLSDTRDELRVEYGHAYLLAEALQGHPAGGMIERRSRSDGEAAPVVRRIESRYAPMPRLPGEAIDAVIVTLRDVTVVRELASARASADAVRALLHERDEFLSVASHELKTPLTAAKVTFGSLVARARRGEEVALESLLRAERQVDRLTALVDALLDVSRLQTGRLELARQPFDWIDAANEAIRRVRISHRDRADDVHVRTPRAGVEVIGDRTRLVQVLVSLVENAVKYSRPGGSVDVRVVDSGDMVTTTVRDHGIGIPQDDLSDLFTRFRKGRNVRSLHYGGLGLSLYLAAEIVRRHGGSISADSHVGAGSTFTLQLPRAAPAWRPTGPGLSTEAGGP